MTEKVTISLIIGVSLIVAASAGAIISTISKNKERDFQATQVLIQEGKMRNCMISAENTFIQSWNMSCFNRGLMDGCLLPNKEGESQNKAYKENQDRCAKMY